MRAHPTKTFAYILKFRKFTAECIYRSCGYTHISNARRFITQCVDAGFVRPIGKDGRMTIYEVIL
jgi:hypothetical protein